jgi:bifunctional non-homologous end joining protein LigD
VELPSQVVRALEWIEEDFILDGECVGDLFHAFDVLSSSERDWRVLSYRDRLRALNRLLERHSNGNVLILDTYFEKERKLERFKAFQEFHAEGVVFKLLPASHAPGRPTSGGPALKFKFTTTGSFIVAGANKCRSVKLKLHGEKTDCGNVTIPPNHDIPKTGAVVEIRYLYAYRGGSLYQPVFLGVRDDISACECLRGQLKFKREEADDDGE